MKVQLEINVDPEQLEETLEKLNAEFDVARISHKQIKKAEETEDAENAA